MSSKVFLSVIVCLALLFSFGVTVKDAKADAIMFPWVVKSGSVSTIITVVNTSGPIGNVFPGVYVVDDTPLMLHYQYIYKTTDKATDVCSERDFSRPTSMNDIVTFDAAGAIGGGKPLFNDNEVTTPYRDARFDMAFQGITSDARAILLVDNTMLLPGEAGILNRDGTLYGEAMVMELSEGAAWGYIAYNASGSQRTTALDFSDGNDFYGEVINQEKPGSNPSNEYTPVVLLNPNDAMTRFFVTPIDQGTDFQADPTCVFLQKFNTNQRQLNINTAVQLMTFSTDRNFEGGWYDNDEEVNSYSVMQNVVCTAALTLESLMGDSAYRSFKESGRQGWAILMTAPGTVNQTGGDDCYDNSDTAAVIGKLEMSTGADAPFGGRSLPGAFNTFNWLRNNFTVAGSGGLNTVSELGTAD